MDPPFFKKADRLYNYYFTREDHEHLRDALVSMKNFWLLSYDPADAIRKLYRSRGKGPRHVELLYSVSGKGDVVKGSELILSNLPRLPTRTRLWRTSKEWKK